MRNRIFAATQSKNDSKCIEPGHENKLRINGTLPEQFIIVQCHIDSTSMESLSGNCLVFSALSQKEVNKIKLETKSTNSMETEIFFVIDNPTIIERSFRNFYRVARKWIIIIHSRDQYEKPSGVDSLLLKLRIRSL